MRRRAASIAGIATAATFVAAAGAVSTFAAHANAICESYYEKLNTVPAPARTAKAIAAYERRVMPLGQAEYATFEKMQPPRAISSTYRAWLAVTAREIGLVRQVIAAGDKNEANVVDKLLAEAGAADNRYDSLANKMGMTVCGQPTSKTK